MAEPEIKIGIKTAYDPAGEQQAAAGLEQVKQAAEAAVAAETQATAAPAGGAQADGSGAAEGVQTTGAAAAEAAEKLAAMGAAGEEAGEKVTEGAEKSAKALKEEQEQIVKVTEALEEAGKSGEKMDLASGAEEQKEALERVAAALDEVAEKMRQETSAEQQGATAAASTANARKGAASAAQDEAARTKALVEQMKLEAMSKRALTAEVQRLTAARKAAAQAGDEKAYQSLTAQYKQAKGALDQMTQAVNLQKTAMMGQASAGMQFANTLGSLSSQLRSGQVDLAGMANGVMSLGMALKAGLGPIGWVMAGIQALSTVIQLFIYHQQEEAKAAEELAAAQNRAAEAAVEAGKAIANAQDARTRKAFEESEKERKREIDNEKQKADNILNAQKNRISGELKLLSEEQAKEEAMMKARIAKGEASEKELQDMRAEYAQKRENLNAELAGAEAEAAVDKTAADLKKSREDVDALEKRLDGLQKLTGDDVWQKLDNSGLEAVEEEIAALKAKESKEKAALDEVKAQSEEWKSRQSVIGGLLKATGSKLGLVENEYDEWGDAIAMQKGKLQSATEQVQLKMLRLAKRLGLGDDDNAIERLGEVLKYREEKKTVEAQLKAAQDNLDQATEANKQAEKGNETQKQINEAQDKRKKAEDELREEEEKRKKVEEEWREKQKETHDEQLKYAREQLQGMKEGTDAYKQWAERVRQVEASVRADEWAEVQKQTLDAQREWLRRTIAALPENSEERKNWMKQLDSNEAATRMKGWQEAQTRTLAEQQAYVERMLGATQEGTLEYEKWALEAKKLNNKQTQEALRLVGERFKTSRSYSEQDLRIEAEQIRADGDILRRKKEYLESLKRRPDIDAATEKAINDQLKETQKAINGYKQAMQQRSLQAQRDLANSKPPDLKPTHKGLAGSLHQAQEAYKRIAARMERAAANNDEKAVAKWADALKRNVRQQEALTGKTGKVVQHMQGDLAKARTILNGEVKGLTARQRMNAQINTATETRRQKEMRLKREKEREAAEAEKNRKSGKDADVGAAKKKAARSYDKLSQHVDKEVSDAAQNSGQVNAQDMAAKVATMQQTVNETRRQMEECRTLLAAANTSMGALAPAVAQMVGVCQTLANTTGAALRNIRREIANLKETVNNLRREI